MSEAGEWIEHNGLNVPNVDNRLVEVKRRGQVFAARDGWPGWLWSPMAPNKIDIIAYRVRPS